jgi:excisionase family DNA binding protein
MKLLFESVWRALTTIIGGLVRVRSEPRQVPAKPLLQNYFTPGELANGLKVKVDDVMALIAEGRLHAIRIGTTIRVPESEIDKFLSSPPPMPQAPMNQSDTTNSRDLLPDGVRWCLTRTGRAKFRVSGSIARGAEIWPGQMRYPVKFPREFMDKLLAHFRTGEFPVGGKFDDPGQGSLGEFIQRELDLKLNPAVYLAALLIDEGYAEETRRGYLRLVPKR